MPTKQGDARKCHPVRFAVGPAGFIRMGSPIGALDSGRRAIERGMKALGNCIIVPPRVSPLLPSDAQSSGRPWPGVTHLTFTKEVDRRLAGRNIFTPARRFVPQNHHLLCPRAQIYAPVRANGAAVAGRMQLERRARLFAAKFVESNCDPPA